LFTIIIKSIGCGIVGIYGFLHYVQNPPSHFITADQRYVRKNYAQTLLPTLTLAYILPTLLLFFYAPHLQSFPTLIFAWQFFPLAVAVLHRLLANCLPDTAASDRIHDPWADLPSLRIFYLASALLAAAAHWYVALAGPLSLSRSLWTGLTRLGTASDSLAGVWSNVLVLDHIALLGGTSALVFLHFRDLKTVGRLDVRWATLVVAFGAVALVGGPGAACAVAWAYREEILAKKPELSWVM
jgi:hypothetical protein